MDTSSILLLACGHAPRNIPGLQESYRAVLSLRDFDAGRVDALLPVLEVLPAGTYDLDVVRLEECDAHVVHEYAQALSETQENDHTLLLLLEEPTGLTGLSRQYHAPGVSDQTTPPDFGFNGTHIYFAGNNFFILDGHHRALAYQKIRAKPLGIRVRAAEIPDLNYRHSFAPG